jgi:type II secretory pathway pseudopilin PulG
MNYLAIALCTLMAVAATMAQPRSLTSLTNAKEHSEQLAAMFVNEQFAELFTEVKKYWPFDPAEIDTLASHTRNGMAYASTRFGKILDSELIKTITTGTALVRYVYLVRMEKHTARLRITYYKGKTGWYVNSFKWDDNIDALLEDE